MSCLSSTPNTSNYHNLKIVSNTVACRGRCRSRRRRRDARESEVRVGLMRPPLPPSSSRHSLTRSSMVLCLVLVQRTRAYCTWQNVQIREKEDQCSNLSLNTQMSNKK